MCFWKLVGFTSQPYLLKIQIITINGVFKSFYLIFKISFNIDIFFRISSPENITVPGSI